MGDGVSGGLGWGAQTLGHQPGLLHVSPGAVENASSLLTYDSQLLVNNFLYGPKHDPTFRPLFPDEITPNSSQTTEVAKLCGDNHFCSFDVAATGSLSVGNATRMAYQLHQRRVQSLQSGEGGGGHRRGGGHFVLGRGPPGGQWLKPVVCVLPRPSGVLRLAGPAPQWAQGWHQVPGGLHHPLPL